MIEIMISLFSSLFLDILRRWKKNSYKDSLNTIFTAKALVYFFRFAAFSTSWKKLEGPIAVNLFTIQEGANPPGLT